MATQNRFLDSRIRERRRLFASRNKRLLAVACLGWLALAAILALAAGDLQVPMWFIVGALPFILIGVEPGIIDESHSLRGGRDAEKWTSQDLRKLSGWSVIDSVLFERSDVDHVIAGPRGVVAIESKYTDADLSRPNRKTLEILAGYASQAKRNARRIQWLLKGNYGIEVEVVPLVVMSGPLVMEDPQDSLGVRIVPRRKLQVEASWNPEPQALPGGIVGGVLRALDDYKKCRAAHKETAR